MSLANLARDHFDGMAKFSRDQGVGDDLQDVLDELILRRARFGKRQNDAAAATATAESPFHHARTYTQSINSCVFTPSAALTANASNYATLQVRRREADGADGDVLFQLATNVVTTGDWTAFADVDVPKLAATAAASYILGVGESLTFEITKTGTGVVVPRGRLTIFYK